MSARDYDSILELAETNNTQILARVTFFFHLLALFGVIKPEDFLSVVVVSIVLKRVKLAAYIDSMFLHLDFKLIRTGLLEAAAENIPQRIFFLVRVLR